MRGNLLDLLEAPVDPLVPETPEFQVDPMKN